MKKQSINSIILFIIVIIFLILFYFIINHYLPNLDKYFPNNSKKLNLNIENFHGNRHIYRKRPFMRNWYGDYWGYRYRPPPPPPIYTYSWFNPWYWNSPICKRGCVQTGIGEWGCQYPGYSYNDCLFASDCRGC